jgi:hypothetical protein
MQRLFVGKEVYFIGGALPRPPIHGCWRGAGGRQARYYPSGASPLPFRKCLRRLLALGFGVRLAHDFEQGAAERDGEQRGERV